MSDVKYAQFKAQTLDYLPPSQSKVQTQQNNAQIMVSPAVIAAKQAAGYLAPPTEEELQRQAAEHEKKKQLKQADFYAEVGEKKNRSYEKVVTFFKYNPFVPIGCLLTVGVLINGVYAMRAKDRVKSQRMMRYRVVAQGSTLIALCVGTMLANYLSDLDDPEKK
jgi:hypothetical protein